MTLDGRSIVWRRRVLFVASVLIAMTSAGCVVDSVETTSGRPLPPEPKSVKPAPTTSPVNAISVLKSQRPVDTTGNGFPNRLDVAVYLFSRPYPVPRHADGALVFTYYPVGSFDAVTGMTKPALATWTFDADVLAAAAVDDVIGPGYALALDLSADGKSRLDADAADLVVEFVPRDGMPVRATSIQRIPFVTY
jgi:hypothetical protein